MTLEGWLQEQLRDATQRRYCDPMSDGRSYADAWLDGYIKALDDVRKRIGRREGDAEARP